MTSHTILSTTSHALVALAAVTMAACSGTEPAHTTSATSAPAPQVTGTPRTVRDTEVVSVVELSGVAEPVRQAMLATRLAGTVTAVHVREGDMVRAGQALLDVDARDVAAKATQAAAMLADARAMHADATTQAARIQALYTDSAATRAQFDASQVGLARAGAAVRAAEGGMAEVEAMRSYGTLRAPFAGVVTQRLADPGSFAGPGMPVLVVQDVGMLRISASAGGELVRAVRRGQVLEATIDGAPVRATVEAVVPGATGNLFTVSATVPNAGSTHRAGSSAVLRVPGAPQRALLVPQSAIVRDGDLTGVTVRSGSRDALRWVRIGAPVGTMVPVTSGLASGEVILVPQAAR